MGEVYVKYNRFVNHDLAHWLMGQGLEVALPPLLSFFLGAYVGYPEGVAARLRRPNWLTALLGATRWPVFAFVEQVEAVLRRARHFHPWHGLEATAASRRTRG